MEFWAFTTEDYGYFYLTLQRKIENVYNKWTTITRKTITDKRGDCVQEANPRLYLIMEIGTNENILEHKRQTDYHR